MANAYVWQRVVCPFCLGRVSVTPRGRLRSHSIGARDGYGGAIVGGSGTHAYDTLRCEGTGISIPENPSDGDRFGCPCGAEFVFVTLDEVGLPGAWVHTGSWHERGDQL